ncbi:hypothetical protein Tco_1170167 [Tanacetum coccineum]
MPRHMSESHLLLSYVVDVHMMPYELIRNHVLVTSSPFFFFRFIKLTLAFVGLSCKCAGLAHLNGLRAGPIKSENTDGLIMPPRMTTRSTGRGGATPKKGKGRMHVEVEEAGRGIDDNGVTFVINVNNGNNYGGGNNGGNPDITA